MTSIVVREVKDLNEYDLSSMLQESMKEGFRHVSRLLQDYADGSNRFDREGEALFAALHNGSVIGVGGLNLLAAEQGGSSRVGRVRRVYVLQRARRLGAGKLLMEAIMEHGRPYVSVLALRTENPAADLFYQALGFVPAPGKETVTHQLLL